MSSKREESVICLFDVDGTLTLPRQRMSREMDECLGKLGEKCFVGIVGGSDAVKIAEQMGGTEEEVFRKYDYVFSENGLVAYKNGELFSKMSLQEKVGEEQLQEFVNFVLRYLSGIHLPFKRGTFIEFRSGMINVSPVGRNCTAEERNQFEQYDKVHDVRKRMVESLRKQFPDLGFQYSIGGQISFDVFPVGWDKTYCLRYLVADGFRTVHFFGDKTFEGGNDYEIINDPRTTGHAVANPQDTVRILHDLFDL